MFCDERLGDRSILKNVDIEIKGGCFGTVDELVEGRHSIFRSVELPVQILNISLELGPVVIDVSRQQLDGVLDIWYAIIREAGIALGAVIVVVVALFVPFVKVLGNIAAIELGH